MNFAEFMHDPARGCAPGRVPPEIFFASPKSPEIVEAGRAEQAKRDKNRARRQCRHHCPFAAACFAWARSNGEGHGIWGGVDMASPKERAKAVVSYGLPVAAVTEPAGPESDEVLVERVLSSGPAAFRRLTPEQQVLVVTTGHDRGASLTKLASQYKTSVKRLRLLLGEDANAFNDRVRQLYHLGKSDSAIACALECDAKRVAAARERLKLPPLYGPGGRLRIGDAQQVQRERVPA